MTRIETYRVFGLCVAVATGGAMLQGCSDDNAGAGSPGTGAGAGGSTGTGGSAAVTYCMPAYPEPQAIKNALISDFEGEAGSLIQAIMPGGVWDADVDGTGTSKIDSIKVESCGTTGNGLHFKGVGHTGWGADTAAALVAQTQPVNVSAYSGISFVIKSATSLPLLFKVQAPYSQPPCGKCVDGPAALAGEECYSGYIKGVTTSTDGAVTTVRWTDLTRQTWGYRPLGTEAFDAKNLVSIAFAFEKLDWDVCIDDVKFIP